MPNNALPDDPETLKAMLLAKRVRNDRLRQIIKELQRHRFGRRAETLSEDQILLGLEDVEHRGAETDGSSPEDRRPRLTSAGSTRERCGHICHGLRSSSTSMAARAAMASCKLKDVDPLGYAHKFRMPKPDDG
jgi:hypothetical protein